MNNFTFLPTATKTAKANTNCKVITKKTVLDFTVIPDDYKAAFISSYDNFSDYNYNYSINPDLGYTKFDINGVKYSIDFTSEVYYIYTDCRQAYKVIKIKEYRLVGFTPVNIYYNQPADIYLTNTKDGRLHAFGSYSKDL